MAPSASSSKSVSPTPQVEDKKERKRKRKEREAAEAAAAVEETEAEAKDQEMESGDAKEEEDAHDEEIPVLSHAERRRRKKEAKLAAQLKKETENAEGDTIEGSPVKKRKLKDGSAKTIEPIKRQNSVWVGNLSFKTQQEDLRRFFIDVSGITRINMPMKAPSGPGKKPENRGFAYVDFATVEAKTAAIALSESPLLGRKLLIKDGDSFEGRPATAAGAELTLTDPALAHRIHSKTAQKILKAQKQPAAPTLFIGNLGFETTEESIRQLLTAHKPGNKKGKSAPPLFPKSEDEADKEDKGKQDDEDTAPKESPEKNESLDDWIRQVRMGTFEDSGMCKGFAFVDFTSVEHATAALINPKNHHLNGRNLLVEYASPDAVRRGQYKVRPPGERAANQGKKRPQRAERLLARAAARGEVPAVSPSAGADTEGVEADGEAVPERPKRSWEHKEVKQGEAVRHKGPRSRPKPGAALALAKRESVAIVASEGKKVIF